MGPTLTGPVHQNQEVLPLAQTPGPLFLLPSWGETENRLELKKR